MSSTKPEIIVYWRPGCGFCSALLGDLQRRGVPHRRINIWEKPAAAAEVRMHANGNETVPTVVIGPVALVNPRADTVLAVAQEHAPDAVPEGWEPPEPSRVAKWVTGMLGGGGQ